MTEKIITLKAPVRIDFAGGTTDVEPFPSRYGGVVLNAAINKYIKGKLVAGSNKISLGYEGDIPTSSGLGTSGVMNLIWLALISMASENKRLTIKNKINLAEKVYGLEQAMGLVGGKQDQYSSALGGINFLEFKKNRVKIKRLKLKKEVIQELENKLLIVYIGEHFSGHSNKKMIINLMKGKNIGELKKITDIAKKMKIALEKSNLKEFANLMNKETEERRKLHASIIPKKTQDIIKIGMGSGAEAVKVLGAGGGGSVLFFGNKKRLKEKFGEKAIEFKFDWEGLKEN